ncbi:serine hydrolase domain-containing protein [Sphingomonas panacisoli]|uniref:serine hydrolase domain-containing protein n=1 Tax=Sphingomonas panacisoli TaxID=1813879 RepID=UPI001647B556|nr:serine hydrolase domain-containing protein [Sphingomonas panacisoli]
MTEPTGWKATSGPGRVEFLAPEEDFTIDLVDDAEATDASGAAKSAWSTIDPASQRAPLSISKAAASEGWDEEWQIEYASTPGINIRAIALRHGQRWTVALLRGSVATLSKRSGTILAVMQSLRPAGVTAENFTDRRALPFDAARRERLKDFWRQAMAAYGVPGIGYAFFDRNGVIEEGGLGVGRVGGRSPITAHTLFRIASNTKGMTTLLIARLVDQGKLAWDEPVTKAYPGFRLGDPETLKAMKVRHLVCACTGMPRQDLEWMISGSPKTPASRVFDLLAPMQPTGKFGEVYQYSNLLAAAGGYVAARAAYPYMEVGAAYDRAMRENVFVPLGMKDTTFDTTVALAGDHAYPHDVVLDGSVQVGVPDAGRAIDFARPAGGAWSSAHDVALYALNELREGLLSNGQRFVSRDALLERRRGGVEYGEDTRYGMGVETISRWGVSIIHHGGALPGWGSDWFVLPDAGVGVVLLMNSQSGREIENETRRMLVELLYGARPQALESMKADAASMRADVLESAKDIRVPVDPVAARRLAVRYFNPVLGKLTIERRGSQLIFNLPSGSSRVGSEKNKDGSTSYVMIDPATWGWTFLARPTRDRDALVIRDPRHEYVFSPAK